MNMNEYDRRKKMANFNHFGIADKVSTKVNFV